MKKKKKINSEFKSTEQPSPKEILYKYVKELSNEKYHEEIRREESLIQQSNSMQSAFAFMSAAIMAAADLFVNIKPQISRRFLFIAFGSILFALLVSLLMASFAQFRVKRHVMLNVEDIEKYIHDNRKLLGSKEQQDKQWVKMISEIDKDVTDANDRRVKLVKLSRYFFYLSIVFIIGWTLIGVGVL